MNRNRAHTDLVNAILLAVGGRPDARALKMNRGKARDPETGQWVEFGVPGQGDILALLATGAFLWIEVKTGQGRQSAAQRNFAAAMHGLTANERHYIVARSTEDATRAVDLLLGRG